MIRNTRRTGLGTIVVAILLLAATAIVAHANPLNHNTTGTGGTHSAGSHSLNPAHNWVAVGASGSGTVTSGGRFHDTCGTTVCHGAFPGSDWSMDLGASGNSSARLYLDYAGYGTGYTVTPNNNQDIWVDAVVAAQGNFESPVQAACYWQQYQVHVTYYDTTGTLHYNDPVGYVWIAHDTSFTYSVSSGISDNATRANPSGTGTIHYINGITVGTVYNGSGSCSTAAHSHMEFYSSHDYGEEYEWHSCTGYDGYSGLAGITDHIHGDNSTCGSTGYSATAVSQGQTVGFIGGSSTAVWMADNPNYSGF